MTETPRPALPLDAAHSIADPTGAPATDSAGPAPLSYATPDADGLPAFDPQAEALIDAGRPPVALRRIFRKRLQASRYFAKSMTRRYAADAAPDVCHVCARRPRRGWPGPCGR